jgi:hypothetical protein
MSYRRKTCECCGTRLQGIEEYWCTTCRNGIAREYDLVEAEAEELKRRGVAPMQIFEYLLSTLGRGQ